MVAIAGALPLTALAYRTFNPVDLDVVLEPPLNNWAADKLSAQELMKQGYSLNEWQKSLYDVTHFNNFQEFSSDQDQVVFKAKDFRTDPWTVEIGGLVENPMVLSIEDIRTQFPIEERVYRMRCVEGWSMVIPWAGFQLSALLDLVKPTAKAKYREFETLYDRKQMPTKF